MFLPETIKSRLSDDWSVTKCCLLTNEYLAKGRRELQANMCEIILAVASKIEEFHT